MSSGRPVRPAGCTSAQRSASVPDLPTVSEAGVPGFEAITWHGVVVPAATSPQLVERLSRDIVGALAQPDLRERLAALGAEVHPGTPREFADECVALGAHVELVPGLIHDCAKRVLAGRETHGWFDVSTLKEPYRLEGKKKVGYELDT